MYINVAATTYFCCICNHTVCTCNLPYTAHTKIQKNLWPFTLYTMYIAFLLHFSNLTRDWNKIMVCILGKLSRIFNIFKKKIIYTRYSFNDSFVVASPEIPTLPN